jgi:hypothetical protein
LAGENFIAFASREKKLLRSLKTGVVMTSLATNALLWTNTIIAAFIRQ